MQYDRLSFKAIFFLILLGAVCASVTSKADDLEEAHAAFNSKDYAKAIHLLTPLAEQGNATAASALGGLYLEGLGVSRDYSEAFRWFLKAAEQRHPHGQFSLGWMYEKGLGVKQDYSEAVKWYRKSAEQGYPQGQTLLGTMYGGGRGVPKDYVGAEQWFRKATSQGEPHGQLWFGRLYLEGWGVSKDVAEAAKWYKLAVDQLRRAGVAVERTESAQGTSASALLLKALTYPPEALALSYLGVSQDLKLAEMARDSGTFHFEWNARLDGTPKKIKIDRSNAEPLVAVLKQRLDIYSNAITQRGFQEVAKEYATAVGKGCEKVGISRQKMASEQDEFRCQLAQRSFQGKIRHRGVIVESALAIEHATNPDVKG